MVTAQKKIFLLILAFIVVVSTAQITSANIYIYWNGTEASVPAGWTCQSCSTGIDFFYLAIGQKGIFPKIANSYCGSDGEIACGGSMSHSHTYTTTTAVVSGVTNRLEGAQDGANTAGVHTHTSLNVSTSASNSSIPLSYGVLLLKATDSAEDTIPANGIIMFNRTTAPAGFNLFTIANGYFLLPTIDGEQNTIIGQENHNHTARYVRTGNPSTLVVVAGTGVSVATTTHNHVVGSLEHLTNQNHTPSYVNIPYIYTTTDTAIPVGALLLSNDTNNWSAEWTKQNYSTWLGRYIRVNSTEFNTTGGWFTHGNPNVIFGATGAGSAGVSKASGAVSVATQAHTHSWVNVSSANADNNPIYSNITIFRLDTALSPPAGDCWTISGKGLKAGIGCLFYKIGGLFGL